MSVVATIAQDDPYWCRCVIVPMDVNCGGQGSLALLVPGDIFANADSKSVLQLCHYEGRSNRVRPLCSFFIVALLFWCHHSAFHHLAGEVSFGAR